MHLFPGQKKHKNTVNLGKLTDFQLNYSQVNTSLDLGTQNFFLSFGSKGRKYYLVEHLITVHHCNSCMTI